MKSGAAFGMVFGLMVGLVIAVILLKFSNKDHKFKTQYDERQEFIKGRGYKISFYTLLYLEALLAIFETSDISFGIDRYLVQFIVILISLAVLCVHSIWTGTYWGLNNNRKRYAVIFLICAALNAIPVVPMITGKTSLDSGWLNVIVLIMMAVIGIELIIKEIMDRREAE